MPIYTKPSVRNAWGANAGGGDLADPGDTYAANGWQLGVKPPRQYFNWVLNYTMAGIRYLCQKGVPDWDATEVYPNGAIVRASNNALYINGPPGNIGNDPASVSHIGWDVPQVPTAPLSDNTARIASTNFVHNNYLPLGAAFSALSGPINNGQVPVGAVTQWQGALGIAGSQVSSAVDKSNKLLINGDYRLFQWVGQVGQPTWLFGSNDGVNIFVWNPSNFHVANSDSLGGLAPSTSAAANTIATRDANGYLFTQYFNQASPNNEGTPVSQVMVTNGVDGFLRKVGFTQFGALINPTDVASPQKTSVLPGGVIIKVGTISGAPYINVPVDVQVNFSTPFPNVCVGIFPCTNRNVAIFGQAANGANFGSSINRFGATVTIDSTAASWFAIGF